MAIQKPDVPKVVIIESRDWPDSKIIVGVVLAHGVKWNEIQRKPIKCLR